MSSFDSYDLQSIDTSGQMYFLHINSSIPEAIESQTVPLNMIVNDQQESLFIPVMKSNQAIFIDSSVEDHTLLNYINDQRNYSYSENPQQIEPTLSEHATNSKTSSKHNEKAITQNPNIQSGDRSNTHITLKQNEKNVSNKRLQGFVHMSDRVVPPRAVAVLPTALHVRREVVCPRRTLPARIRFGPVQGVNHVISQQMTQEVVFKAASAKVPIFLKQSNNSTIHIDVSDQDKSNWFSLLPLGDASSANVWLLEEDGELYGVTVQPVPARAPLVLGYSKQYAEQYMLPSGQPVLDLMDAGRGGRGGWCARCECPQPSAALLQRHALTCLKDKIQVSRRRRYRCRNCSKVFSRLFTLKRHMSQHCSKKPEKPSTETNTDDVKEPNNDTPNMDDNRIPSDESLQNYTNGLDFPTSLFDTDRMPNLDVSGSSRSEIDFNSYDMGDRDDNSVPTDLTIGKNPDNSEESHSNKNEITKSMPNEPMLISCPHCKQTIVREKKRQHLRKCPESGMKCDCGRTFSNRKALALHVLADHSTPETKLNDPEMEYKCEECQHTFKRRGMLVNHLWRVHGAVRVAVPLARRERLYPCAACPKLYRTADKRARHVRAHHPGVEVDAGTAIEGGVRRCVPAACWACPRQYATRAKLLQHVRALHPLLAPPLKKNIKSSGKNNK